ncbi:enoyl-CoA hydratase-related protein [Zavarzinia compransoris]|nr:enoyl-CoA hydratase-related protein [Zavarzinia compransoris]TDP43980.1 enoyl-CoA hydratase/carnithine racemase [Zavarzinia compransoris]
MTDQPILREFRIEDSREGIIHLVFDMPGRTMNVFSNAAIHEIGRVADWLRGSDVRGVVLRSGKATGFCAGADLNELGVAYDMIMQRPKDERTKVAYDHFFPLSRGLRALETAGKPVAVVVDGLALGGGCEFALAAHYRVLTDNPKTALGLPESLVGLLPGAGGTQRMPRVVGIEAALPILLEGGRFSPATALAAGLAHEVVAPEAAVAAAERWILSGPEASQPWDRQVPPAVDGRAAAALLDAAWTKALADPGAFYPAPFAILDCIRGGIEKPMDRAIEWEMTVFAGLIQRPEPRNMIQTLFLGKLEHDRRAKAGALPDGLAAVTAAVLGAWRAEGAGADTAAALAFLGLGKAAPAIQAAAPVPVAVPAPTGGHFWFEAQQDEPARTLAARLLIASALAADAVAPADEAERRVIDYALVARLGYPAYVGGPLSLARYLGQAQRLVA